MFGLKKKISKKGSGSGHGMFSALIKEKQKAINKKIGSRLGVRKMVGANCAGISPMYRGQCLARKNVMKPVVKKMKPVKEKSIKMIIAKKPRIVAGKKPRSVFNAIGKRPRTIRDLSHGLFSSKI